MIKHEAKFHARAMRWLKYNLDKFPDSFLIESKVVRPDRVTFSFYDLSGKEEKLLLQAKNKCVIQTHSDYDRSGTNCDASVISGGGFIFIYWVRKGNKKFYVIDIEKWVGERDNNIGSNLTEERAEFLAYVVGELKS